MATVSWQKTLQETHKSYMAFCVYRNLGRYHRSLEKVRVKLGRKKSYLRWLEVLSSKYHWVKRAKAYDIYLDELTHEYAYHSYLQKKGLEAYIPKDSPFRRHNLDKSTLKLG